MRQRDTLNPTSTEPIITNVYLHPKEPDLREMLADTPLDHQIRGVGLPLPPSQGGSSQPQLPGDKKLLLPTPDAADVAAAAAAASAAAAAAALRHIDVDAKGRALARGRRKASSARVWLSHGVGDVTVNRRPLGAYFNGAAQRAAVIAPLMALGKPGKWNVHATVEGGGAVHAASIVVAIVPLAYP